MTRSELRFAKVTWAVVGPHMGAGRPPGAVGGWLRAAAEKTRESYQDFMRGRMGGRCEHQAGVKEGSCVSDPSKQRDRGCSPR